MLNTQSWACKMVQPIKCLLHKPSNIGSIPAAHTKMKESTNSTKLSSDFHKWTVACAHKHTS